MEIGERLYAGIEGGVRKEERKEAQTQQNQVMQSILKTYRFLQAEGLKILKPTPQSIQGQIQVSQQPPKEEQRKSQSSLLENAGNISEAGNRMQNNARQQPPHPKIVIKISRFLAIFLQDLERKVMDVFERAISEGDEPRQVDTYIHDGCLIRKFQVSGGKSVIDWELNTMAMKTKHLVFEQEWTYPNSISYAAQRIKKELGLDFEFTTKTLDVSDFHKRLDISALPYIKKTFLARL